MEGGFLFGFGDPLDGFPLVAGWEVVEGLTGLGVGLQDGAEVGSA